MSPSLRPIDYLHRIAFWCLSLLNRTGLSAYGPISDWQHRRADPWAYASNLYERSRHRAIIGALDPTPVLCCLEVGCSEGVFTELLAADPRFVRIVAVDVSRLALARARVRLAAHSNVEFRIHDIMRSEPLGGPYDVIFFTDVLYYLGASVGHATRSLCTALTPGGRLVLGHHYPESVALFPQFANFPGMSVRSTFIHHYENRPYEITVLQRDP